LSVHERPRTGPHDPEARPRGPLGWYLGLSPRGRAGLWLAFVIWLGVGALFVNWDAMVSDTPRPPAAPPDPSDLVLVVAEGGPGERPAMALVHRGSRDATVVLLPPGTVVEVPGLGPKPLVGALREGGPDSLATAVANELQVRVPKTLIADEGRVAGTVDALGGVTVDVPETIEVEQERVLRRLYTRGPQRMDGVQFARFLTLPLPDEPELDRLTRQDAAWRALLRALANARGDLGELLAGWRGDVDISAAATMLRTVASTPNLQVRSLPVVRQPIPEQQLYRVDPDDIDDVRDRLSSVLTVRDTRGRRVRLLVGADGVIGPDIGRQLIEAGFRIELTQAASQPYDDSRVVIALERRDTMQATADRLLQLLGTGRLAYERHDSSYFDATVVVGRDWAAAHGYPQATPTPPPRRRR